MIYLDNNATTKVLQEVTDDMIKYLTQYYGNPSSQYYELANISKIIRISIEKTSFFII